jgi:tetratricopeptide (TPR) repeat protein
MRFLSLLLILVAAPLAARAADDSAQGAAAYPGERLGMVVFPVSCSAAVRASFSRGVALLHDFWYEEARPQFERILKTDPNCAMAHWGVAMSIFHEIWERPDDAAMKDGWQHLKTAQAHPAKTAREREYIAALASFYRPGTRDYMVRIGGYTAAMATLSAHYPDDIDAATFYALSLLADEAPGDASLSQEHKALAILNPLFEKYPDHPGVVHYIIHACDTPSLAPDGLTAAQRYGQIAPSGPHAVHMPGHIFSRLGLWREDIDSQVASVAASDAAGTHHENGDMDQFHSDDFLLYAYLQTAQDARAKATIEASAVALTHFETMPGMGDNYMTGMFPYYRTKLPVFYALEMRDWSAAAALEPTRGATSETKTVTYWARSIGAGHLHQAQAAKDDLEKYDALMEEVKKGQFAYYAESIGARVQRGEMLGWIAFAAGNGEDALKRLRETADLQDKVGQGEVDIPAREMLADMLLESGQPRDALAEYQSSLKMSPNRFNALFNAGRAAEAAGDKAQAQAYYTALLKSTDNGSESSRPEFAHMKLFLATALAAN